MYLGSAYHVRQACQTRAAMWDESVKFQLEILPLAAIWLQKKLKAIKKVFT